MGFKGARRIPGERCFYSPAALRNALQQNKNMGGKWLHGFCVAPGGSFEHRRHAFGTWRMCRPWLLHSNWQCSRKPGACPYRRDVSDRILTEIAFEDLNV